MSPDLYTDHFNFTERPFSLLPDPDFLFWSQAHARAFSILEYGLVTRAPLTVVTGEVGDGDVPKLQATYDRDDGEFTNNNDGTYRFKFSVSVTDLPQDILDQAATEGLDLSYEADRTHRIAIQFDGNANTTANPNYDWVPSTGATDGIFTMDIAATENCNSCHDPLNFHGGNRRTVEYCVTCHNPGSTDANSANTVDMKVMIHKIHMGADLPSVQAGE